MLEWCQLETRNLASKLYGVNATIIIFVFVLYCIVTDRLYLCEECPRLLAVLLHVLQVVSGDACVRAYTTISHILSTLLFLTGTRFSSSLLQSLFLQYAIHYNTFHFITEFSYLFLTQLTTY